MIKTNKILISLCLLCAGIVLAKESGQAGAFLRYGVGGRALGMGRAYVAAANDASAIYWNPAGIIASERPEVSTMYTNLYYDTQYTYFGIVYPRILKKSDNAFLDFMLGKWSAVGFGWTGLASSEYEQRTAVGAHLGQFSIQENAFYLSWARELVSEPGVLQYGLNLKMINQSFPGLAVTENIPDMTGREWSAGLDMGFRFKPIHAPVFNKLSLKYLLPMTLGLNFQNLIAPKYQSADDENINFPLMIRWGVNYRLNLKDWIPTTWFWMYETFGSSCLSTSWDWTWVDGAGIGSYWGLEGIHPVHEKAIVYWRTGVNNQSDGPALGAGIEMPFTDKGAICIDYSYGTHPYLPEDSRFFMTFKFGKTYKDQYFFDQFNEISNVDEDRTKLLLKTLEHYPNGNIQEAVEVLAAECDSSLIPRYFDLIGGLGRAEWLMADARKALNKGDLKEAKKKAEKAAGEYNTLYRPAEDNLSDRSLLDYGEALVLMNAYEKSLRILPKVKEPGLKSMYLTGIAHKKRGNWDDAIAAFREVTTFTGEADNANIKSMAFLGWGEALMGESSFEAAVTAFDVLLKRHTAPLNERYLRHPFIEDKAIQDDAQYLKGLARIQSGDYEAGIVELLKVIRYYPELNYGDEVARHERRLMEMLKGKRWTELQDYADQLYADYLLNH